MHILIYDKCVVKDISSPRGDLSKHVAKMNPCKSCLKKFMTPPCDALGSCAFEGANVGSFFEDATMDEDNLPLTIEKA
jgi:hypothetical protein